MSRDKETDTRRTEQQNDGRVAKLPTQHSNKWVMGDQTDIHKLPIYFGSFPLKIKALAGPHRKNSSF